jgi:hypothetical protein
MVMLSLRSTEWYYVVDHRPYEPCVWRQLFLQVIWSFFGLGMRFGFVWLSVPLA